MKSKQDTVETRLVTVVKTSGEVKEIKFVGFTSHPEYLDLVNATDYQDEKLAIYSHLAELLHREDYRGYHSFCEFLIDKYLEAKFGKK